MMEAWSQSPPPDAVVFDNDGLLLDTESVWTRAEQDLFERRGTEFTPADKRELVGTSAEIAGGVLEERLGEPGRAAELIEELNELVVAELEHGVEAMIGARELLRTLRDRGTPIGLVSNSPLAFVTRSLQLVGFEGHLRRRPQRPRSRGAEAGPRPLPGGLPAARGRGRPRGRRAGGLADRGGRGAGGRADRDRRALDRGGRARGGPSPGRVAARRSGRRPARPLRSDSNPQVEAEILLSRENSPPSQDPLADLQQLPHLVRLGPRSTRPPGRRSPPRRPRRGGCSASPCPRRGRDRASGALDLDQQRLEADPQL